MLDRLEPLLAALETASVVLTPHLLGARDGCARADDPPVRGVQRRHLRRRATRPTGGRSCAGGPIACATTACTTSPAGMHYEQRWLDLVPGRFGGVHVLRDPTVNVGHWNLGERRVRIRDGRVLAGDEPCRLFRFSGYDPAAPEQISAPRPGPDDGAASARRRRVRSLRRGAGRRPAGPSRRTGPTPTTASPTASRSRRSPARSIATSATAPRASATRSARRARRLRRLARRAGRRDADQPPVGARSSTCARTSRRSSRTRTAPTATAFLRWTALSGAREHLVSPLAVVGRRAMTGLARLHGRPRELPAARARARTLAARSTTPSSSCT